MKAKNYYERYVSYCLRLASDAVPGSKAAIRRHNAAMDQIAKLQQEMLADGCLNIVQCLLEHEEPRVVSTACAFCFQNDFLCQEATEKIKRLIKSTAFGLKKLEYMAILRMNPHPEQVEPRLEPPYEIERNPIMLTADELSIVIRNALDATKFQLAEVWVARDGVELFICASKPKAAHLQIFAFATSADFEPADGERFYEKLNAFIESYHLQEASHKYTTAIVMLFAEKMSPALQSILENGYLKQDGLRRMTAAVTKEEESYIVYIPQGEDYMNVEFRELSGMPKAILKRGWLNPPSFLIEN